MFGVSWSLIFAPPILVQFEIKIENIIHFSSIGLANIPWKHKSDEVTKK